MSKSGAALYPCAITHVRTGRARRAFTYGSYLWLVDLDDLPRLPAPLRPLARFEVGDHLGDPAAPSIRANVESYLRRGGIDLDGGRITMLAGARVLGYEFNPLSVFWCHHRDGNLAAVLAEVHNTYGERHAYVLRTDERGRAQTEKDFYVSPYLPLHGRYRMHLPEPGERLRLSVTLDVDDRPALVAGVRGRRRPASAWRLLGYSLRFPWASLRVTLLIRWQGIRLFVRRVPLIPRPAHVPQEGVQ